MTDDPGRGREAEVVRLDCRRFEDMLAEGRLDAWARAHQSRCDRCAETARAMARVEREIADATAPASLPAGFGDGVWSRFQDLDAAGPQDADASRGRWSRTMVAGFAVAAIAILAVGAAYWAGGVRQRALLLTELTEQQAAPQQVLVQASAAELQRPAADQAALPTASTSPVRLLRRPVVAPAPAEPQVPAAQPVPEPVVDVPSELRAALARQIETLEVCPEHAGGSVRLTVTVLPDGSLTNRQLLSAANAGDAHRCVGVALDRLALPPLSGADAGATVTLDLTW